MKIQNIFPTASSVSMADMACLVLVPKRMKALVVVDSIDLFGVIHCGNHFDAGRQSKDNKVNRNK